VSVRPLRENDLEQLFALRQVSFLDRSDFSDETVRARHRARLPHTFGHFLDDKSGGKLTSAAVCYSFEMFLAGQRVRVGGLAGVLSAPETRRRGFVRELLKYILEQLHQDGVGWALEYPFDPRFYARYGFATVPTGCEVTVPAERLFQGAAPDATRLTGDVEAALAPIYHTWAAGYSLTLARGTPARPSWSRILDEDYFCYLLDDAYVIMELEATGAGQTLVVHDYAFASPAGRERLWRFVGSFYGQADLISLHLPSDEPLGFDLHHYHTNELPALQARITNLQAALGPLRSAEKTFELRVDDPFCSPNDGVFHVALGPTGSTVTRSSGTPDLSVQIGTLSQLVAGALSPAGAMRAGLAEGDVAVAEALASPSAGRTTFMPSSDYF